MARCTYLLTRSSSTWHQSIVYLKVSNFDDEDEFGVALSLSGGGDTLVARAIGEVGSAIAGATAACYTLAADDSGQSIVFEVIPIATSEISTGRVVVNSTPKLLESDRR